MGKIIFKKSDYRYSSAIIGAKENVLLAAAVKCSQNIDKGISWGYNEIVAKISSDGGESWSEEKTVLAPPARKITADEGNTKSAFFINPTLLTAPNGDFVIVFTFYPECMGEEDEKLLDKKKTPFTGFNSKTYPVLYDRDGNYFIVLEDGKVIDSSKQPTEYTVKGLGELYRGEEYLGNIHLNGAMGKSEGLGKTSFGAPLKSPKRSYIMMIKSSDGINWSEPKDITPNVICESDGACVRTSKGNGAVCENGRMIVPLTAPKGAAFIYSDDNGESWNRNMRMPYIPVKEDISVLQTSGGELLAVGKKACISFDNGITWMKSKSKFAPIKAIANGEKFMTSINTKSGTVLVGGEFEYKKNKYKGVEYSEDTLSIAGGLLPCTDIKVFGGKYATIYITPDNKEVSFDIM